MLALAPPAIFCAGYLFMHFISRWVGWTTNEQIMAGVRDNFDRRASKFRLLVGFTQIMSRIGVTFRITFPPIVMDFMAWLNIFEFVNVFSFAFIPNCLYSLNYYDTLLGSVAGPSFVLLITFVGYKLTRRRWVYEIFLVLSFTSYPSFCDCLFRFFDCEEYADGQVYLVIDPSIKCDDPVYLAYSWPVAVLALIIPFGIIFIYYTELHANRQELCPHVPCPEKIPEELLKEVHRSVLELSVSRARMRQTSRASKAKQHRWSKVHIAMKMGALHEHHDNSTNKKSTKVKRAQAQRKVSNFFTNVLKHEDKLGVTRAELTEVRVCFD
jgi:hypothetical protein